MKVQDVMTSNVDWAAPDTSVYEVAKLMKENDVGSIPICQNNKLIGILTDRDIVLYTVANGKNPKELLAGDIMSTDVVSISPSQDAHEAANLMASYQIRRLPVIDQGNLVGIVSIGDLALEKIHINEAGEALNHISQHSVGHLQ